jgi:putative spermidine/putrescine transport system permease protein
MPLVVDDPLSFVLRPSAVDLGAGRYVGPGRALVERLVPTLAYRVALLLILVFIAAPIAVVLLSSVNATQYLRFPPEGFSTRWWQAALSERWMGPTWFSLQLAGATAILATVLGTLAALGVHRGRFPGREGFLAVLLSPLILPQIVTGAALLQFLALTDLRDLLGFPALLLGHVVITLPYAVRTVTVSLHGLDPRLEWAAQDLGANPLQTFRRVTLPLIKNGVFAGFVFAFIVSFNDVPISLFLGRPGSQPIPIAILGYVESRFDPAVSAVAVVTVAIVLALIALGERFARVSEFIYQQER